jgi:ABC-type sugar transport system ATPase subunit
VGITKRFGAVVALRDAAVSLGQGEVLAIVGDNGAGKSTLMKVFSGVIRPDEGHVCLDGNEVDLRRPGDALDAGIETVYQDLALVDTMTAFQNIYLGREKLSTPWWLRAFNLVDDRAMKARAREILRDLKVKIPNVNASVKRMSGGQRQGLAIARAVLWGRRIVILDEPTAALGVQESRQVLDLISRLKSHDVSVIVVSHNMQQVVDVADRVTVMRLGRTVASRVVGETTVEEIVGLITGAIPGDS